jgi:hypothetical protein
MKCCDLESICSRRGTDGKCETRRSGWMECAERQLVAKDEQIAKLLADLGVVEKCEAKPAPEETEVIPAIVPPTDEEVPVKVEDEAGPDLP